MDNKDKFKYALEGIANINSFIDDFEKLGIIMECPSSDKYPSLYKVLDKLSVLAQDSLNMPPSDVDDIEEYDFVVETIDAVRLHDFEEVFEELWDSYGTE